MLRNHRLSFVTLALAVLALAVPPRAQAQNGCVDSPENPTAVLLLVGSVAAGLTQRFGRRS